MPISLLSPLQEKKINRRESTKSRWKRSHVGGGRHLNDKEEEKKKPRAKKGVDMMANERDETS